MGDKEVVAAIFAGRALNPAAYTPPTTHRYTVVHRGNKQIMGSGLTEGEAHGVVDLLRTTFGGTFDILETETTLGSGNKLFSGEVSKNLPHVSPHVPIDESYEPEVMFYDFDMGECMVSLIVERDGVGAVVPIAVAAPTDTKPPMPPKTIIRKPAKPRDNSRERSFAGISDETILQDRGYVVIDLRNQERLFSGTQQLCIDYIQSRNVSHSRDRLPLWRVRVVRYADYADYQAQVEAQGKVIRYRGQTILIGLQGEITKALKKMMKDFVNPGKHLTADDAGTADLWWVQNRFDAMRKVG